MPAMTSLIAPCGMNYGIYMAYLKKDGKCHGCHGDDTNKSTYVIKCIIRNCEKIKINKSGFCYECSEYLPDINLLADNKIRTMPRHPITRRVGTYNSFT